jgi:uncharacterized protein YbaA (DUF1428 family)
LSTVACWLALTLTARSVRTLPARQVRDARRALNEARAVVKEHVATVSDETVAWGQPVPDMPYGVYRRVLEA